MADQPLSPAAQAVLDEVLYKMCAGESDSYAQMIAAAALRAVADQVSPAAQAVLDAYINAPCGKPRSAWVAAALRAAADQAKRGPEHWEGSHPDDFDNGWEAAMGWVAIIAAELEAANA